MLEPNYGVGGDALVPAHCFSQGLRSFILGSAPGERYLCRKRLESLSSFFILLLKYTIYTYMLLQKAPTPAQLCS